MNAPSAFRTYPIAVALILAELAFWALLIAAWMTIQRVAPNVQLEHESWQWMLASLPVMLVLFLLHLEWKRRAMDRLMDSALIPEFMPRLRPGRDGWRFLVWRFAMAGVLLGILDPKVGAKLKEITTEGVDIMVALDVSNSMMAEDVGMDRLSLAKRTIERFINQLDGDRLGLVVFAGEAYVQCPITTDYGAMKLFLDQVSCDLVATQGTAIGRAIEACAESFDEESAASRVILVMTDGENHEDDAEGAAKDARANGIEVHTIGMGSVDGAPIPLFDRYGHARGFKSDADGKPVVTALNEIMLIGIANAGGGTFTLAGKGFVDLNPVRSAIDQLEQQEVAQVAYTDFEHRASWFFLAAMVLLFGEAVINAGQTGRHPKPAAR
jgi:Ca-activated chloride channel family protein